MDFLVNIFGEMTGYAIIASIISLCFTLLGLYALGEKYKSGFMLYNVSLACQIYLFYTNIFIVTQLLVLAVFNFRNYIKWKREENNNG